MEAALSDVITVLARVLRLPTDEITAQSSIRTLPNADSATILQATIAIEDHFGVEFPDELVFRLETVADVAAVVERLRHRAGA